MTQVTFKEITPIKKLGNLKKGVFFRYEGVIYIKTHRCHPEGSTQVYNALRLSDGEQVWISINTDVEAFVEAEVKLK